MNPNRQQQKFGEIMYKGHCLILHEEAGVFETLLQARGVPFKTTLQTTYQVRYERGTIT